MQVLSEYIRNSALFDDHAGSGSPYPYWLARVDGVRCTPTRMDRGLVGWLSDALGASGKSVASACGGIRTKSGVSRTADPMRLSGEVALRDALLALGCGNLPRGGAGLRAATGASLAVPVQGTYIGRVEQSPRPSSTCENGGYRVLF